MEANGGKQAQWCGRADGAIFSDAPKAKICKKNPSCTFIWWSMTGVDAE